MTKKTPINKRSLNDQGRKDVHRKTPKTEGGEYTSDNVEVLDPIEHMKHHDNLRIRSEEMEKLKSLVDAREQLRKSVNSSNNRILAYKRGTDMIDEETMEFLNEQVDVLTKRLSKKDREIEKHLTGMNQPIIQLALGISGIGAITVSYMLVYIDIEKAQYASSMWSYVGYDKASHERYTKGQSSGGNKTLRTVLYNTAASIEKNRKSPYRVVYEGEKLKLQASNKITKSRNTKGQLLEIAWKDVKPCHRRGAAIRKMMKHFLADFWYVWRTLEGLETPNLYVEEKLGHKNIIRPSERGWNLKDDVIIKSAKKTKIKISHLFKDQEVKERKTIGQK